MTSVMPLVGFLGASIAIYLAIALLVRTLRPVGGSPQGEQPHRPAHLAIVLYPVEVAFACVQDKNEQDWTWRKYLVATLLLALVCLAVLALLALGLSIWTMLM